MAFFVHGFAKNEQDNIRHDELVACRMLAEETVNFDDGTLFRAMANRTLVEVACDD